MKIKLIISSVITAIIISGCATGAGKPMIDNNQKAIIGTTLGALTGIVLGNNMGGGSKNRNKVIGAVIGATIGGTVGYNLDKQAKEVASSLNTYVDNSPNADLDPNQDLIVSNTDSYVKIMFRDSMMFQTNSANPTISASGKISKITNVLEKYPNTLVQVIGHTDSRGSYSYNKTLSQQRASNVGNIIHNFGVKNQILSIGCSFDKPIAPNNNTSNMGLNRRVEIYLYPNTQSVIDICK